MTRRPAINAVERSGQPVHIVGGKTVEILRHIPIHQQAPRADGPASSIAIGDAGSFSEWFA